MIYDLVIFDWEGTLGDGFNQTLIPGANEFLARLQKTGVKLAIATNKRDISLQKDLIFFNLNACFQVTRTANQTAPKPDPKMLLEILEETGVSPEKTLMIGDSESDMVMAHAIGITGIGLDLSGQYGASLRSAGANFVFRNYTALAAHLFGPDLDKET